MTPKENILVTGGSGLVGHGIRLALESTEKEYLNKFNWIFLSSKDLNLLDREQTLLYFKKHKPLYVINLAARVGGLFANMKDNNGFFLDNMHINLNVFEAAHQVGVKRLLCGLSTCIFPDHTKYPIDETMVHLGPPHNSNYGYSYAKRMVDVLCRSYNEKYNTQFVSFIPTNVYGPYDNFNLQDGHVLPALIHKAFIAKKEGELPLDVMGTGKPLRQFIYSVDLGRLIVWTLFEYKGTEPIILSVPESDEVSIGKVAELVAKYMNVTKGIRITNEGADGQFKKTANTTKLQSLNPNFKFTPFEEALAETCKWFNDNYQSARK